MTMPGVKANNDGLTRVDHDDGDRDQLARASARALERAWPHPAAAVLAKMRRRHARPRRYIMADTDGGTFQRELHLGKQGADARGR